MVTGCGSDGTGGLYGDWMWEWWDERTACGLIVGVMGKEDCGCGSDGTGRLYRDCALLLLLMIFVLFCFSLLFLIYANACQYVSA